jgi:hypothetical protein
MSSVISRSENDVLSSWKTQGVISRISLAIEDCFEECVVAGGLQVRKPVLFAEFETFTNFRAAVDHLFILVQGQRHALDGRQR